MDGLDIAILAVAGYLAVAALVRLMLARQRGLSEQFRAEMRANRRRG
ncbi:MAG: hypothetical protein R3C10_03850 [Pirellulales bacterium]|nr:hypothetical protein [Planctomycetales bacterium]